MRQEHEQVATIYGLISAAILSNIPPWVLNTGEKLLYGALLALLSGFMYKAGGFFWDAVVKARKGP